MKPLFHILVLAALLCSCSNPHHDLLITNVNVIDVATGFSEFGCSDLTGS